MQGQMMRGTNDEVIEEIQTVQVGVAAIIASESFKSQDYYSMLCQVTVTL